MAGKLLLGRRSFLHLIAAAGTATLAVTRAEPWLTGDGAADHPGAPLRLGVEKDGPRKCSVRLTVNHDGVSYPGPAVPSAPGGTVTLEAPYPHADLVPGRYDVRAELLDSGGATIAHLELGGYDVRRWRFST